MIHTLLNKAYCIRHLLERFAEPVILLLIRVYMFDVFYSSGKSKLDNWINDDWGSTVALFEDIHPVPYIPANIAAVMGTAGEVILSSLFLVGLCSRFSAAGLLVVTAMIELAFHHMDPDYVTFDAHIMWALLLSVIAVRGAGPLSLDNLIFRRARN